VRFLRDFQREATRYVALQRAHLLRENMELLPLADGLLSGEDDEAVMQGFVALEKEGPEELKRIFERVRALCGRLGVEAVTG
jgi:hemerythrin-like domain-containing protein